MPWKDHDVTEERWRFIEEWKSEDWSMAELCEFYRITRKTAQMDGAYESRAGGPAGSYRGRRKQHPNQVTTRWKIG
jgi:hypothetical protein